MSCNFEVNDTHRRDGVVISKLEGTPQITVSDALKPVCPTEMLENKSPRWANVVLILERLSPFS